MDFLTKIIRQKKEEVAESQKCVPESRIREKASAPRVHRSFVKQLERPGVNIIAEIKRASPSKGLMCPDLNPAAYASEYQQGGAAAISVLTDAPHFQGSSDDLKKARAAVTLPVLRKDFIISEYQIYETAAMGADAALLIVRVLSREQLRDYLRLCHELNLDALVETHSKEEIEAAIQAEARIVGINNRNLSSFETDIRTAAEMVSLLANDQIPVAESGIRTREDIELLQGFGIHNFLIGESLVRSPDPRMFLKSLRNQV